MESSLYVAAAAQRNMQKQLTVIANNIANMNTAGYRTESVDFKSLISRTSSEDVHYPTVAKLYTSLEQGTLEQTGNPLDVAISGDAWFSINTPSGPAYTRDGRFKVTAFGELQTLDGNAVLDAGGAPIQLDPRNGAPEIAPDGRILENGRPVGNLGIFQISQDSMIGRYSNSAIFTDRPGVPIAAGTNNSVNQGFIENSNVNPMKELASLIAITKTFNNASTMIERTDSAISKAVNELGGR